MGRFRAAACVILITACGGASQSKVHGLGGTLSVSPATLDFGDVALGKQLTHELVLRNTGLVPMTVNNLPQFANPSFEVTGLPATLGPGSSANATVRYRPPGLGPHERMLQSEEHTSELQSHVNLVCRLLLEKKKNTVRISLIVQQDGRDDLHLLSRRCH